LPEEQRTVFCVVTYIYIYVWASCTWPVRLESIAKKTRI
jgi:hypothetical protein